MHKVRNHATQIGFSNTCAHKCALGGERGVQLLHINVHLAVKELNKFAFPLYIYLKMHENIALQFRWSIFFLYSYTVIVRLAIEMIF